jgi:hypothetical protein
MNDAQRSAFQRPPAASATNEKKACSQFGRPLNHSELVRARGALSLPLKDGRYRGRTQQVDGWTARTGGQHADAVFQKKPRAWLSRSLEAR